MANRGTERQSEPTVRSSKTASAFQSAPNGCEVIRQLRGVINRPVPLFVEGEVEIASILAQESIGIIDSRVAMSQLSIGRRRYRPKDATVTPGTQAVK